MAAPLPDDEQRRLVALDEYRLLDTAPEEAYDDIVRRAARTCGTPAAALTLVAADRQWFKARLGLPAGETPRAAAFCAHTILQKDILVVPDAPSDPRFADNPLVTGEPGIRFYAGAPLITAGGHALGALCVLDTVPRSLTPEQERALGALSRQVVEQMDRARLLATRERFSAAVGRTEAALRQSRVRLEDVLESMSDSVVVLDRDWRYAYVNAAAAQALGRRPEDLVGRHIWTEFPEAVGQPFHQAYHRALAEQVPLQTEEYHPASGCWFESRLYPTADGLSVFSQDVTERKRAERERREAEEEKARLVEYNRLLLESTAEGIYGLDTQGRCTFINRAAALLLGYAAEAALGREMHALIHHSHADGSHYPVEECPIYGTFRSNLPCHVETEVLWRRDGTCFPAAYSSLPMSDAGGVLGAVVTFTDITERRRVEQEKERSLAEAREQADRDPLTGLLNHRAFYSRLDAEGARAAREGTALAVVMLDLDGFKFFNDVYGHVAGDEVLRLVAGHLRAACRPYDTPARFGGDEFALLLPAVGDAAGEEVEAQLRAALRGMSCRVAEGEAAIPVSVSLGAALFPDGGADCHAALRRADERLHWAKTGGGAEENARRVRADAGDRIHGFSMLDALVAAVDNKDRYTRRHSEDVMEYSLLIARALGMGEGEQRAVAVSALLHDVGKIGVPDAVLRKPGRLTDAEFGAVKQHPMMGAVMVQAVPGLEETLDAVRHHHERWDGAGYPAGLKGEETPLIARLMAVADAFSAMTTDRPYRQGMGRAAALDILAAGAGTQWDPACVAGFLKAQRHGA